MSKRKVADTLTDPTLPKTPITLNGTEYNLCFDLGSLAEAEAAIMAEGRQVNLMAALPVFNFSNVRLMFAAAILKFHPEISFTQALSLVTLGNVYKVANVIHAAWTAAMRETGETEGEAQPGQ